MVLQVGTYSGQMDLSGDSDVLKVVRVPYAREHEQFWRIYCPGRKNDFLAGVYNPKFSVLFKFYGVSFVIGSAEKDLINMYL